MRLVFACRLSLLKGWGNERLCELTEPLNNLTQIDIEEDYTSQQQVR